MDLHKIKFIRLPAFLGWKLAGVLQTSTSFLMGETPVIFAEKARGTGHWDWGLVHPTGFRGPPRSTVSGRQWSTTVVFNLFHLTSHINSFTEFCLAAHQKVYFLLIWQNKIGVIWIHSHHVTIVVLAVAIFLFDNLREKRYCMFQNPCSPPSANRYLEAASVKEA